MEYWRGSNLPVIIALYRRSDESLYWQAVPSGFHDGERRLRFVKERDVLYRNAVDRLAALTVAKNGFGHYVPPLGEGEDALVDILPVILPPEMYVASTPHSGRRVGAILLEGEEPVRFDWTIRGGTFWSFPDPRTSLCREIVDVDQVEAIETSYLAFHEDIDEQNNFAYLLKNALRHQFRKDLGWQKKHGLLYTNGSMPYYGTYPGLYDPRPLLLCPHPSSDSTVSQVAEEVFALTKINWNSTQMNQRLPIPIRATRKVGEVLKYVREGQAVSTDYCKYI